MNDLIPTHPPILPADVADLARILHEQCEIDPFFGPER